MSGRTWTVTWTGQRAVMAMDVLDAVKGGPFRCGTAGAIWTCAGADYGPTVTATLLPWEPHDVDPARVLLEAPIPERAS